MRRNNLSSKASYDKPTTIVCKETTIETSKLKSKSSVQISGNLIGDIDTQASLMVGDTGKVTGNIKASFALIAGEVFGNIEVLHQLQITSTGKLIGDINCESMIVDDGAVIEGVCKMMKKTVDNNKKIAEISTAKEKSVK